MCCVLFILTVLCPWFCCCSKWEYPSPYSDFLTRNGSFTVETEFNESRVRAVLHSIVEFGPRPTGSDAEKRANFYILKQLLNIKRRAKPYNEFDIQIQKSSGSFPMDWGDGMMVYYMGVTNLAVRIGPYGRPSLLVSCHYDTPPNTVGATSSALHCAVMVETLFVISQYNWSLTNSLIFLFNSASEYGHQAAHGFITKHPWAKNITAFINLDAFGSVGRLMAIEAGPENPWMVEGFAYSASFPLASIIAQEMIQTDAFWIFTDYRMYCDIGKIPGLDLVHINNGYIQRTKYDTEMHISSKDLVQAGENMLAVIHKLLKSTYLVYPTPFRKAKLVYFDILGIFLVSCSTELSTVLNEIISLITILEIAVKIKLERQEKISASDHVIDLVFGLLMTSFSCLFATGWNAGFGALMEISGGSMSWYSRPSWIVGLYICPAVACLLTVHWVAACLRRKKFRKDWMAEDKCYDSTRLFWIITTIALSRSNYQAAYVCITWVLFPTIVRSLLGRLFIDTVAVKDSREKPNLLIMVHFMMQVVPLIVTFYVWWMIFLLLIPNLGRAGTETHPDIIIGTVAALLTFSCLSYTLTLLQISKPGHFYLPWIIGGLATIHVITLLIVLLSKLGFPYSGDVNKPSPQLYSIVNVERSFQNYAGEIESQDNGYWLVSYDANGIEPLLSALPEIKEAEKVLCEEELLCGMPFNLPYISRFKRSYYLKNNKMKNEIKSKRKFEHLPISSTKYNAYRLTFVAQGSDYMNVAISPRENVRIHRWSMNRHSIKESRWWKGRPTYFVYYIHGSFLGPWQFWIDVTTRFNYTGHQPLLDIAFICHHLHGNESTSTTFTKFLNRLPNWIHATSWTATYDKYTF